MSDYKALVTFDSKESMEAALNSTRELLMNHFEEVRKWSRGGMGTKPEEFELNVMALHRNAWTSDNIKKVGEVWGGVVCFDKLIKEGKSFSAARILIDTCLFQFIQGWVYLSIGGRGYDISVKEIGSEVYGTMCFIKSDNLAKSSSVESIAYCLENVQQISPWNENIPVTLGGRLVEGLE